MKKQFNEKINHDRRKFTNKTHSHTHVEFAPSLILNKTVYAKTNKSLLFVA